MNPIANYYTNKYINKEETTMNNPIANEKTIEHRKIIAEIERKSSQSYQLMEKVDKWVERSKSLSKAIIVLQNKIFKLRHKAYSAQGSADVLKLEVMELRNKAFPLKEQMEDEKEE